jgi:hypothetical protein
MAAMKKIHEIKKIEISYMASRSNEFEDMIPEDNVLFSPVSATTEPVRPFLASRPPAGRLILGPNGFRRRM